MKFPNIQILSLLVLVQFTALSVCASENSFKITDPNQGHAIFTKALNDKNLEILVAMYADDAVMVAPGGIEVRGKKAIREFFIDALKTIEGITLDTVFRVNYPDIVVFRSRYTVVYKAPDGKTISQKTSGIEVERKQKDGTWLFVIDHHYGGADYLNFQKLNKSK